ncbi:MAG: ABC transporter ATP-binding protein [Anaerolineales bacterium]
MPVTSPITVSPARPGDPPAGSDDPSAFAIYCQGLSKHYGEVKALVNLDLSVPYGSIFGFLGRNGAGKTTLMRLLSGLAIPTSGRGWVAGLETTSASRLARARFGYLPQDPAFYTWMTAREYLDYVAQIQGLPPLERKSQIESLLALSDLQEAANRRIQGFSGGMLQRLGIAQALIGNPPVLLLDEPTSALDPAGRYDVLDMISSLRGKVTVFLSSHILTDIERVCDTLAVLHKGRLILVSSRDELLQQYAVNAVELDIDMGHVGNNASLLQFEKALQDCNWVANAIQEGSVLRIMVHDVPLAKRALIPLLAEHKLALNRYEWVRPSLEDIFLQLSA